MADAYASRFLLRFFKNPVFFPKICIIADWLQINKNQRMLALQHNKFAFFRLQRMQYAKNETFRYYIAFDYYNSLVNFLLFSLCTALVQCKYVRVTNNKNIDNNYFSNYLQMWDGYEIFESVCLLHNRLFRYFWMQWVNLFFKTFY